MPGINDEDDDDLSLVEEVDDPERAALLEAIAKATAGDDEDDTPLPLIEETEDTTISVEEGAKLLSDAKIGRQPKVDPPQGDQEPAIEPAPTAAKPEASAPVSEDAEALLTGIDGDRRAKLQERITQASEWSGLLATHGEAVKAISENPVEAFGTLVQLHQYANQNPDQYLAWAAWQLNQDDPAAILTKAAEHLGLKVVPKDDSDPFEDEEVKRLRQQNMELERRLTGGRPIPFGPDVPRPEDALGRIISEKNPDGSAKRPYWKELEPLIGAAALAKKNELGRPVTAEEIAAIYDEQVAALASKLGGAAPQSSVAARPAAAVAQPGAGQQAAAPSAVSRAKAASKSIDGTGQGAPRHSGPEGDGSIRSILEAQLKRQNGG